MPRLVPSLVLALVLLAVPAREGASQGFGGSVFAGAAVTTFDSEAGTSFDPAATFSGGFGGGYDFGNGLALRAEIVYVIRAALADLPVGGTPARIRFQYTDLELPAYFVYTLPIGRRVSPVLLGGAAVGLNRDARLRYRALAGGPTFDEIDDAAADRTTSAVGGVGIEAPFGDTRAFLHARLHVGLDDVREQEAALRSRTLFLVAGFAF